MRRKLCVLLVALAVAAAGAGTMFTPVRAVDALIVNQVNKADIGYGMSVMIDVSADAGTYWQAVTTDKITYVDKDGADVLDTIETCGNNVALNRNKRVAEIGDVVTVNAGFTYGGKTTEDTFVCTYTAVGSPWNVVIAGDEPPPVPEDVTISIERADFFTGTEWGWPALQVNFLGTYGDHDQYWSAPTNKVTFTNAWGDELEVSDVTRIGHDKGVSYFLVRLTDHDYRFMSGDKVAFEEGFCLRAYEKLGAPVTFVNTSTSNSQAVLLSAVTYADAVTITNTDIDHDLPVEASLRMTYQTQAGRVGTPYFTSSDTSKATVTKAGLVTAVAEGTVTITAHIGTATDTFELKILPKQNIDEIVFETVYDIWVLKGGDVVIPSEFTAKAKYANGSFGSAFSLDASSEGNFSFGEVDTSTVGKKSVDAKITYKENDYDVKFNVEVYETTAMDVKEVAIVEWFDYCIFIQIPNSSINLGNITSGTLLSESKAFLRYERADGTEVPITGIMNLGTNIAIFLFQNLNDENYNESYLSGDRLIIEEGMYSLYWTGKLAPTDTDNNAIDPGTGMVIKDCEAMDEMVFRYDGATWGRYIEYTDITAESVNINVVVGKVVSANIIRVPSNATVGEITYTSSSEAIATVNALGVIRGIALGTTTVTVKIDGGLAGEKTLTLNITVSDEKTGLVITPASVTVKSGKEIDLSALTAKYRMASGAEGASVSLTGAVITGFDNKSVGEQTVVIAVTIDGVSYSGTLTVKVEKGGCGGAVDGFGFIPVAALCLLLAGVCLKKKKFN